jgi:hypothetical protein
LSLAFVTAETDSRILRLQSFAEQTSWNVATNSFFSEHLALNVTRVEASSVTANTMLTDGSHMRSRPLLMAESTIAEGMAHNVAFEMLDKFHAARSSKSAPLVDSAQNTNEVGVFISDAALVNNAGSLNISGASLDGAVQNMSAAGHGHHITHSHASHVRAQTPSLIFSELSGA